MTKLSIGVVGAGRVGAVLAAALRSAGHEVVAAAGESDASRRRIDALLPGVEVAKPTDVARASDLLLLTVRNPKFGPRARFSAMIGRPTREEAQALCTALIADGGNCIVQKNEG